MRGETASRQAAVLADPDRVQLLALLLGDPLGEASVARLAGGSWDDGVLGRHLAALAEVGLVDEVPTSSGAVYRPTHDALARFGALLGAPGVLDVAGHASGRPDAPLARVTERLVERFAGSLSAETVGRFVDESYELLASRATVRTFLPLLTARFAAERLEALAGSRDRSRRTWVEVLFVCTHNAGRSQLAAAALRTSAGGRARARTAGSEPASRVEPAVLEVIESRGWSAALDFPKPLTDEAVKASDYVVTMGCGDACPVVPGRTYLDWQVPDPAGQERRVVEAIADEVERRVGELLRQIGVARLPASP